VQDSSGSPWREGVARHLAQPIAAEWPLLKVQRSVASQGDEWQVTAAAVIRLQNLTGCSQHIKVIECQNLNDRYRCIAANSTQPHQKLGYRLEPINAPLQQKQLHNQ
jgi:hypothetical protein